MKLEMSGSASSASDIDILYLRKFLIIKKHGRLFWEFNLGTFVGSLVAWSTGVMVYVMDDIESWFESCHSVGLIYSIDI